MVNLQVMCYIVFFLVCGHGFLFSAATDSEPGKFTENVETDKQKHYKEGVHNVDYDHEAFLGEDAKEFSSLSPEESRNRLAIIVDKIDNNKDNIVTEEELKDWIQFVQDKYVRDNVERSWKNHNPTGKEMIKWEDYSEIAYEFMKDMGSQEINKVQNGISYKSLYDRDRRRWEASDQNNDGFLNKTEYSSFLHPEEFPHMRQLIILETIEDLDKDKDGKISLEEYIGDMYQAEPDAEQPEWVQSEVENYKKYRDKDGDGFLTGDEVKNIVIPEEFNQAEAEARHLIYEADVDGDKALTKEEILNKYDLFVGSQATDYGEALKYHDEL